MNFLLFKLTFGLQVMKLLFMIPSPLAKTDFSMTSNKCPFYRDVCFKESQFKGVKRQGPTPGVPFTDMSVKVSLRSKFEFSFIAPIHFLKK